MQEFNDTKIIELLSNENEFDKGFKLLVKKYQERLYWHIRRQVHFHADADDILQNTFIKVFKNIKGFQHKSKLYTWMYRIATNETITYINKNKKHIHEKSDKNLNDLSLKLKADKYFDGDEAELLLIRAIEQLPEKQKLVFNLRYYDNLSYKSISEILNITEGSLKASFHHAMKKVEAYLKENVNYV